MESTIERPVEKQLSRVRAWDLPTRLFHWALVGSMISAWASYRFAEAVGDNTMKWHRYNGYAILTLLVWRVMWGFVGSSTSRWSTFVRWPWTAAGYLVDLMRGRERPFLGHNPLGTYMVLALLIVVGTQAVLGLMAVEHNDTTWGPLYKLVSEDSYKRITFFHKRLFNYVLLPLIAVHLLANLFYGMVKKDPLIPAMITGSKPAARYEDGGEAVIVRRSGLRALACLAFAAAIVFGGIVMLGGKLFY